MKSAPIGAPKVATIFEVYSFSPPKMSQTFIANLPNLGFTIPCPFNQQCDQNSRKLFTYMVNLILIPRFSSSPCYYS
jgi:hypothetical protein